jgi:hypothetical protein
MVTHVCNLSIWEAETENGKVEAGLGFIARPHLKKREGGRVIYLAMNNLVGLWCDIVLFP